MSRAIITINRQEDRERAARWAAQMPWGTRIEFREAKRSLDQNALLWSRLSEIARQVVWHGQKLTPTDWKDMFTASLRKARVVPNLEGDGFVLLGLHTSEMTKAELTALLDLIDAFAAERGVTFNEIAA